MSALVSVPIVCMTEGCPLRGETINVVSEIEPQYLDAFYEDYDDSSPEDHCPLCGELGVACDPVED